MSSPTSAADPADNERARRWRLVLGNDAEQSAGASLSGADAGMDRALEALYGASGGRGGMPGTAGSDRRAGLGSSAPSVARWLGDIRSYFPSSVVRVMQKDALERLDLQRMLLEPEMLEAVEPDVHLVSTLIALKNVIPNKTRDTARLVVRRVVEELQRRLANSTRQAIIGALNRSARNNRPRYSEIDWHRTIRANLKHYQPAYRTIIPERRIGWGRKRSSLRDIILCVDQSGSMAASVVYSSVFGAVLASLPAVSTRFVVFDTAVVDLTETMSKMLHLGMEISDIVRAVTSTPAEAIRMEGQVGTLKPGAFADLALFEIADGEFTMTDTHGESRTARRKFKHVLTVANGELLPHAIPDRPSSYLTIKDPSIDGARRMIDARRHLLHAHGCC